MTANAKDTIYIDVDDEITSIIDKVRTSSHQIVALVLPKRASMLQSTVNMKLLKRASDSSKKKLVLITSEAGLLPLAGAVGLHVAKTLQSKPEIPTTMAAGAALDELLEAEVPAAEDFDPAAVGDKPVGELAGDEEPPAKAKPELTPRPIPRAAEDTVALDNTDKAADKPSKTAKKAKDKKLKVPNFERFRLKLILGILGGVALIILLILAAAILPKATVSISTNTSNVASNLALNLDTAAQAVDPTHLIVPANQQQIQKTGSKQVSTTGQKNEGQIASGTVNMSAQECAPNISQPATVPGGTGITANGLTFITQGDTSFTFNGGHGSCVNYQATSQTSVTAQNPGTQYNLPNGNFSVPGHSDITVTGSTSGGTTNNVQIVAQTDIDSAKSQIALPSDASMKASLANALTAAGYYPIQATYSTGTPSVSPSANVGNQATSVTVTENVTYTMFGAKKADLNSLINSDAEGKIDTSKQQVQNTNLDHAGFSVVTQSGTKAQVGMLVTATVGPKIDIGSLKAQIAGKKKGDVMSIINKYPGVTSVSVHYSPFWVSSTPKSTSKITIKFQKAP